MNTKTDPLTKGHNSYPWKFQQTVGGRDNQQQQIQTLKRATTLLARYDTLSAWYALTRRQELLPTGKFTYEYVLAGIS
jgi:hypothetical protein